MMRLAIDIVETIDGFRLDIHDVNQTETFRINPETKDEAILTVLNYLTKLIDVPQPR